MAKLLRRFLLILWCAALFLPPGAHAQGRAGAGDAGLRAAVVQGDTDALKRLLPADAGGDTLDALLIDAAYYDPADSVELLLARGAHGNAAAPDGWTALLAAIKGGRQESVELLLKNGADPRAVFPMQKLNALLLAAQLGRVRVIRSLLAAGASPDEGPPGGDTPLAGAVRAGQDAAFRALLDGGANVDARGTSGETALLAAIREPGRLDAAIPLLLARKANASLGDDAGNTPLIVCVQRGDRVRARQMLNRGADTRALDGRAYPALAHAIMTGQDDVALELITRGADAAGTFGENGDTPLIFAARYRRTSLFGPLLDAGAGVNDRNRQGETALMLAAWQDPEAARGLLSRGADGRLLDAQGRSVRSYDRGGEVAAALRAAGVELPEDRPRREQDALDAELTDACRRGDAATVAARLRDGAQAGDTGWMAAAASGYDDVLKVLLDHRPSLADTSDADGMTPLMHAAAAGRLETVRLLLARAGPVRGRTRDGLMASDLAARNGHGEIRALLEDASTNMLTLLSIASRMTDDAPAADAMIDALADVNAAGSDGETLLSNAVRSRSQHAPDFVRHALARGADPEHLNHTGDTALTACLQSDRPEVTDAVAALVEHGVDVNRRNTSGVCPLLLACRRMRAADRERTIKILRDAGARN